jgi:hypothetical protein
MHSQLVGASVNWIIFSSWNCVRRTRGSFYVGWRGSVTRCKASAYRYSAAEQSADICARLELNSNPRSECSSSQVTLFNKSKLHYTFLVHIIQLYKTCLQFFELWSKTSRFCRFKRMFVFSILEMGGTLFKIVVKNNKWDCEKDTEAGLHVDTGKCCGV